MKFARQKYKDGYSLGIAIGDLPIVITQLKFETHEWSIYIDGHSNAYGFKNGELSYIIARSLSYWMIARDLRLKTKEDLIGKEKSEYALFGNEIAFEPKGGPENWKYLRISSILPEISFKYWNGVSEKRRVSFYYNTTMEDTDTNQYSILPWDLGDQETGLVCSLSDKLICQDRSYETLCDNQSEYTTWNYNGEYLTQLPLDEVEIVIKQLLVGSEMDLHYKINFKEIDFALLCFDIRIIELYMGIPLSLVIYYQYTMFSQTEFSLVKRYNKLISHFENKLPSSMQTIKGTKYLRAIGLMMLLEFVKDSGDYLELSLRDNFLSAYDSSMRDVEVVFGLLFEDQLYDFDLTSRLNTIGNLPLTVLHIILSANQNTRKAASFINPKKGKNELYSRYAIDTIYFENLKRCSDIDLTILESEIALV